jgi:hypothetical protein
MARVAQLEERKVACPQCGGPSQEARDTAGGAARKAAASA